MSLSFTQLIDPPTYNPNDDAVNTHLELCFVKLDAFMYRSKLVINSDDINYKEQYTFNKDSKFYIVHDVVINGTILPIDSYDVDKQTVIVSYDCNINKNDVYFIVSKFDMDGYYTNSDVTILDIECDTIEFDKGITKITSVNSDFNKLRNIKCLVVNGILLFENFTYKVTDDKLYIEVEKQLDEIDKISLYGYVNVDENENN